MNRKKQLMKNTIIIFFGKVCTQLLSFFLLPLYTGYLSTKQYGVVDLIQTYVTLIVPLVTLELEMSIFRYLVDSRKKKDKKESKKLISNNFFMLGVGLLIFTILYLLVTTFWHINYRYLILFDIIVCTLSGNLLQISRGMGRVVDFSISCIITGAVTILSNIITIVYLGLGSFGMVFSMAIANLMCAVYLFFRLKLYKMIDFSLIDKKLMISMNKYSIPLIPNGVSWWIVNVSDRTIISVVLGASFNGIYAVSNKFPTIISSLLGIFNLSWSESAVLHVDSPDRDEFFSDIVNTATKLFSALSIGMIGCLPFVFPILINSKYNDAYNYIPILILGALFNVVICLYSGIYIAKKLTKQVASTAVVGAVINILVNIILIKRIGLFAAAVSTTISYLAMLLYRHFDLKKYVNVKFEKGLILKILFFFVFSSVLYYINNIYLNIMNLVVVILYSVFLNKEFLLESKNSIISKFRNIKAHS